MSKKKTNTLDPVAFLEAADKVGFLYETFARPSVFDLDGKYFGPNSDSGRRLQETVVCGRLEIVLTITQHFNFHPSPNALNDERFTQVRYLERGGKMPAYSNVRLNNGTERSDSSVADARMALGLNTDQSIPESDLLQECMEAKLEKLEAEIFGGNLEHACTSSLKIAARHAIDDGRGTVPEAWLDVDKTSVTLPTVGTFQGREVVIRTGDEEQTEEQRDDAESVFSDFILAVYEQLSTGHESYEEMARELHWKKLRENDEAFAVPFTAGACRYSCAIDKACVADLYDFDPDKIDFIWVPSSYQVEELKKIEDLELRDKTQVEWANQQMLQFKAWSNSEVYSPSWTIREYATLERDEDPIRELENANGFSDFWNLDENREKDRKTEEAVYKGDCLADLAETLTRVLKESAHGNVTKDLVQVVREREGQCVVLLEEPPVDQTSVTERGRFICSVPLGVTINL